VPRTASDEVELYLRTYYSLLRTTAEIKIRSLEEVHAGMHSLLHPEARSASPDMSAFIYSVLRLPDCMPEVRLVVLGQSTEVFREGGYKNDHAWKPASARARRRRCFFDGKETLFCFIASRSDIDDVIPLLTAYQIEWNKLHVLLRQIPEKMILQAISGNSTQRKALAEALNIAYEDLERLATIWGADFEKNVRRIAQGMCSFGVRLLSGSLSAYRRATHEWWGNVIAAFPSLRERPVYFVSSNTHSVVNLISGFALQHEADLIAYLESPENRDLYHEWQDIRNSEVPSSRENFLYYVYKKFQSSPAGQSLAVAQAAHEQNMGILRVPNERSFDIETQIFDLSRLDVTKMDRRLCPQEMPELLSDLRKSNACILNIDYPLGLAAYNILSEVAENVGSVLGVYIMGKAATLNGVVGDVMIPNVIHDEHSQNTYLFDNAFSATDVAPYLVYGTVLDNQKSVTVRGTFLQNARYMDVFYREGYTDIEMEAGPYLSTAYEMHRPKRHPVNEIVNLYGLPFDLGVVHYASDTPLSKGKNLGVGSLSYYGMDSTYAVTLAILRRIFAREQARRSKLK